PNRGLINIIISKILEKNQFTAANHTLKELTPDKLLTIMNSQNLFGDREMLKITSIGTGFSKDYKKIFTNQSIHNFPCFIGEESLPSSGIRKFFEDQKDLASIACYYETPQNINKLIVQQCRKRNISISEDALFYLSSHLKGDQQVIKSELEKLFFYTYDKNNIDIEDIQNSLSSDLMANGDQMCIYFAKKEIHNFVKETDKLKQQNVNEILMIRALIRYFLNVYYVVSYMEDSHTIDVAMKKLSPPIFYKYVNDFKQVVRQYNSTEAMEMIRLLCNCEKKYKIRPNDFHLLSILNNTVLI
ncbi:MAG: hypothetical protein DGJ47_001182, partial [Rickettsiaceae bacterium]